MAGGRRRRHRGDPLGGSGLGGGARRPGRRRRRQRGRLHRRARGAGAARRRPVELAAQILICPNTDLTAIEDADLRAAAHAWMPNAARLADGDVSPLHARDLHGVAPAVLITAGDDALRAEGDAYAERLRTRACPTVHRCEPGLPHGFVRAPSPGEIAATDRLIADVRPRATPGAATGAVLATNSSRSWRSSTGAGAPVSGSPPDGGLRERDDVADRVAAREDRHDPVDAHRDAAVRRRARACSASSRKPKRRSASSSPMPSTREDLLLDGLLVDADRAAADLDAVEDEVVAARAERARVGEVGRRSAP